jgi:hypothetical protein
LPNYWADASALGTASRRAGQFKGWLTDAEISAIAKRNYREITAVCWNWNEFDDNQRQVTIALMPSSLQILWTFS